MKSFTRAIAYVIILAMAFFTQAVNAQSVIDPADPIVTYNPSAPPAQPPVNTVGKWVRTVRLTWNTTSYKCYVSKLSSFPHQISQKLYICG